jgi:hypothetical protein
MTSSVYLKNRWKENREKGLWNFDYLPDSTMKGWDDSYLRAWGECHPDFIAIPIGHVEGYKMCVRRANEQGKRIDDGCGDCLVPPEKGTYEKYFRQKPRLYSPHKKRPVQEWNPQSFCDRRIPNEGQLVRDDYLRLPIKYNGTGITLLHDPYTKCPFDQYAYSYTPLDNTDPYSATWAPRSGAETHCSVKPHVCDRTRAVQPLPVWKREQAYMQGVGN